MMDITDVNIHHSAPGGNGWSEVGVETLMERMKSLSERSEEFSESERAKR